ncbi:MAG: Ig-like domain-containing protein [Caldilineaceae bacterium]
MASSQLVTAKDLQLLEALASSSGEIDVAPRTLIYGASTALTNTNAGAVIDANNTGVGGGLCVMNITCSLINPGNVVDSSLSNAAHLTMIAGATGSVAISLTQVFSASDQVGFVVNTGGLLDVSLLTNTTLRTYKAGVLQEQVTGGTLLAISLLSGNDYQIGFPTTRDFDGVQLSFSGLVLDIDIKYAYIQAPTVAYGIHFSDQLVTLTSLTTTVTISNTGSGALNLNTIELAGTNSSEFTITGNTCAASLASGMHCTVAIAFAPNIIGNKTARLDISSDDSNEPLLSVDLSGTAIALPDLVPPLPPLILSPLSGAILSATLPTIQGIAEANSVIDVYANGSVVCSTTTDGVGTFSCMVSTTLPTGSTTITATATDGVGNVGLPSLPLAITIDTLAPAAPILVSPLSGAVLSVTLPIILGTAEADSVIHVYADGSVICSTTANGLGSYSCTVTAALLEGNHVITATAIDLVGNVSVPSNSVSITISNATPDTQAPITPTLTAPTAGSLLNTATPLITGNAEATSTVKVYNQGVLICSVTANSGGQFQCTPSPALQQGNNSLTATATDAAQNVSQSSAGVLFTIDSIAPAAPTIASPATNSVLNITTPLIVGTAEAGSSVSVREGNQALCATIANSTGNWSCTPAVLAAGTHTLLVTATDTAGNSSSAATRTFMIDLAPPLAPTMTSPAPDSITGDSTPTLHGTGEIGAYLTATLAGQVLTTTVGADGHWRVTVINVLADGVYTPTLTLQDAAGNVTGPVNGNRFIINTVDSDGDGLTAQQEAQVGTDPNDADSDSNKTVANEGNNNINDGDEDFDGDGATSKDEFAAGSDPLDPQSKPNDLDGDGIPSADDPNDRDQLPNGGDNDSDGISDHVECPNGTPCPNSDGDDLSDYLDADSDGDGILDASEGTKDTDLDGIPDRLENNHADTDGDTNFNHQDNDDDGDGIPTSVEDLNHDGNWRNDDADGDLIPAYLDPNDSAMLPNGGDSDSDGLSDASECATGVPCQDTDKDGIPDYVESNTADKDGDGTPDYMDPIDNREINSLPKFYLPIVLR